MTGFGQFLGKLPADRKLRRMVSRVVGKGEAEFVDNSINTGVQRLAQPPTLIGQLT